MTFIASGIESSVAIPFLPVDSESLHFVKISGINGLFELLFNDKDISVSFYFGNTKRKKKEK